MPTSSDIEDTLDNAVEEGVIEATSDGQTAKSFPLPDLIQAADRKAASEIVEAGNAWGAVGRARVMPNWTEKQRRE